MILEVDAASPVPPYEQLRVQIADLVAAGSLSPGHRLPSIRQLANDLGIAPGTVARAYRELEAAQVVRSRVRHGTVVAEAPRQSAEDRDRLLRRAARDYLAAARRAGASPEEALAALRDETAGASPGPTLLDLRGARRALGTA